MESGKANEVNDLKGIGEAAWGFILALYESRWDKLIADNNNHSFRWKVKAQFTPKISESTSNKNTKKKNMDKPASIFRLPPPISAKSGDLPKEVNKISKFFKKNNNKKEQKNCILKLQLLLILPEKFWKSKKCFLTYRPKKLRIYKKSSVVKIKPNLDSI